MSSRVVPLPLLYGRYPSQQVETIGVLGAGLMGAGIAEVSIGKNLRVLMKDKDQAGLFRAGRT